MSKEHTIGTVERETFDGQELAVSAETASTAVAAQATAAIQARYVMALRRPRSIDDARVALLRECKRPNFAEVARYHKPVGKGVTGPSIRFAEAAIRCMTNIMVETATMFDDRHKRIVRVTVTDLEANLPWSKDVTIEKVVERRELRGGQIPIAKRKNSYGKDVYLVPATDDEIMTKEAALVSKTVRTLALRLIPGDLVDEAMAEVVRTQNTKDAADPDAARKKIVDGFAAIGVRAADLSSYLGHDLGGASPAEMAELRALYAAIRDGEATWADALALKTGGNAAAGKSMRPDPRTDALRQRLAAAKPKKPQAKPESKAASRSEKVADTLERQEKTLSRGTSAVQQINGLVDEVDTALGDGESAKVVKATVGQRHLEGLNLGQLQDVKAALEERMSMAGETADGSGGAEEQQRELL